MIRCKYYKKSSCTEISLLSWHLELIYWWDISHISSHFSVSSIEGILSILQVVASSSSPSLLSSLGKLLYCRDGPSYCSLWGISSLTIVPDGIFFSFPLFSPRFSALFCCDKFMSISFIKRNFPENFFAIEWVIVTVSKIIVKVK